MNEADTSSRFVFVTIAITALVVLGVWSVWTGYYWLTAFMAGILVTGLFFTRILFTLARHLYTGIIESSKGTLAFSFPYKSHAKQESDRLRQVTVAHNSSSTQQDAKKIQALEIMLREHDLLNEHLQDINSQLEMLVSERTAALERSHAARRNLIANISHDLRTPITLIQGYTETLLDGIASTPEDQLKYLNLIHARVLRLNRLIQELFDLNQLESGQLSLRIQPISATNLAKSIYEKYETDTQNANLSVKFISPDSEPQLCPKDDTIYADPDRIERVFLNLLTNSIRHTMPGGTIYIGVRFRRFPSAPEKIAALFFVQDTGNGIADEDLPFVFNRYYQSPHRSDSRKHSGSGLGLAIAKEIVTAHNGQIWVESQLHEGTTFTFSLPLAAPSC